MTSQNIGKVGGWPNGRAKRWWTKILVISSIRSQKIGKVGGLPDGRAKRRWTKILVISSSRSQKIGFLVTSVEEGRGDYNVTTDEEVTTPEGRRGGYNAPRDEEVVVWLGVPKNGKPRG